MTAKKIWGMSYGLVGDLIMGLPMLAYFEKKYPGSYKYWVIEKKCAFTAPLYLNHPLIDRIRITEEWSGNGPEDEKIASSCDIRTTQEGWGHTPKDWYNYRSCVEETAIVGGIPDLNLILTEEERKPRLVKWFDVGFADSEAHTYSRSRQLDLTQFDNNIAIWPFATAGGGGGRSPSVRWWGELIEKLLKLGYTIYHYGRATEPTLSSSPGYLSFTSMSYFEQVQASLASKLVIGTDSGSQWVMGAYSHPAINLMTIWLPGHTSNLRAFEPVNDNAETLFSDVGCDAIPTEAVVRNVESRVPL